jgi:hypothetical protein
LIPFFATSVNDAGGKFAAGIVDTAPVAKLPPVSTTLAKLVANLPTLSLIRVMHLDLQISPRIFENI